MKRILKVLSIILLAGVFIFTLTSCGNRHYIDFEFDNYKYVHSLTTGECYEIQSWTNMDVGIKVKTKEYGILYFSEGTYILVGEKCPVCNHE